MWRGVALIAVAGLLLPPGHEHPPADSARPTKSAPPGPSDGTATKIIAYVGHQLRVPASWPVYRLDEHPTTCVRFDRHAVYLGRPGEQQDCPARLVGRTEAILIEPMPGPQRSRLAGDTVGVHHDRMSNEIQARLRHRGLRLTATYGQRRGRIEETLAGLGVPRRELARPSPGEIPEVTPPGEPSAKRLAKKGWRRTKIYGAAFDTCAAPSLRAMRAWRRAYRTANIYIGGSSRACPYGNLDRRWVRKVRRMGWHLIPSYVGLQAPCNHYPQKIDPDRAYGQGKTSADNAIRKARRLGLPRGVPIYFDMEAYNSKKKWCRTAVLKFLSGWTRRLHQRDYLSGVYSSVATGIRDLSTRKRRAKPDDIWFAHWDNRKTVWNCPYISDRWWRNKQRIKQYRGPHKETHGGVEINVDSNVVYGDVV